MGRLKDRLKKEIIENRERVINGKINCLPSKISKCLKGFLGTQRGKYYIVTGTGKSAKTKFTNYLFVNMNILYAYTHRDIKLKITMIPLEEEPIDIYYKFVSFILNEKCNISIDPDTLSSVDKNHLLDPKIIELIESKEISDILDFYESCVDFWQEDSVDNLIGKYESYAREHGKIHEKEVEIVDEFTGEITKRKEFDRYEPEDPEAYHIFITDHVSLLAVDGGSDLRKTILRYSKYLRKSRNRYGFTHVLVQQQGTENQTVEAYKLNKVRPTANNLSDCKDTYKDCNMLIGLFNPLFFGLDSYGPFDIKGFWKDNIRFVEIIVSRNGRVGEIAPLLFDGAGNNFDGTGDINNAANMLKIKQRLATIQQQ